jgi:hypothetical protein
MGVSIGERMVKLDLDNSAPPLPDWATVLDQLLLGISHNISNRVATLAGVSDILSADPAIPPILRALSDEIPRLGEGIRLLRLLAVPDGEREEAVEATRLVDDAISLAALHPACRNIRFELSGRRDVPPVVARPTALVHELVVALVAAASELGAGGEPVEESYAANGEVESVLIPITFASEGHDLVISAGRSLARARLLVARGD